MLVENISHKKNRQTRSVVTSVAVLVVMLATNSQIDKRDEYG